MFSKKINIRNSSSCKKDLLNALDFVYLIIYLCCNCAISNKAYCVNYNFEKYIKYIRLSCNYNLAILFILIK